MLTRILIIKPSSLGDVATTLPLLCDLRRAHPAAKIDWLLYPAFYPLVERHDAINSLIPFDRKKLGAWWYKPTAFNRLRTLFRTLRANKYDAVVDAQGLFRSAFLARISSSPVRIGFADAREAAPIFYTEKIWLPEAGKKMLAVDRMRSLGKPLHTDPAAPAEFRLPLQPAALDQFDELARTTGLHRHDYLTVIPGARWNTKRWPLDRYIEIVRNLLADGHRVLLLGSPDEKPLCDQLQSAADHSALLNLAGQTDLALMCVLLANTRLLIANDSGPLHVAAALATPAVALYGPTDPAFVGPYAQIQNVLRHDVPCFPCRHRDCSHHSCMNGLSVETVWQKTTELLAPTINGKHA